MQKTQLFHSVFFQLKDSSESAIEAFINDCRTYLRDHPGILSFHIGRIVEDYQRDVSMRDFHVSLHIIFENKQSHDNYQISNKHTIFVERNKDSWSKVRDYDVYIQ